ncbi:Uncharacterised protein [Vibrio cholerae]|nr:Uncharacterised protein [Vibrio cholerae]
MKRHVITFCSDIKDLPRNCLTPSCSICCAKIAITSLRDVGFCTNTASSPANTLS